MDFTDVSLIDVMNITPEQCRASVLRYSGCLNLIIAPKVDTYVSNPKIERYSRWHGLNLV